ncbi:TPA: inverse autotransporter beta domain-containing protein [Salmonella enterica subsp. enterica serovar Thompson]
MKQRHIITEITFRFLLYSILSLCSWMLCAASSVKGDQDIFPYDYRAGQIAQTLRSGNYTEAISSYFNSGMSEQIRRWLGGYGYSRINVSAGTNQQQGRYSGDFLLPVFDSENTLLFSQIGIREHNNRIYANYGIGMRYFTASYMTGANLFMDRDYTGGNSRLGIGGEYFYDYLKMSSNLYKGMTDWHDSADFKGEWSEKPADGFDVRIDGNLPFFPAVGLRASAEKYYGNNVSVLNRKKLRSHPVILSSGINYTPVPLLTFSMDGSKSGSASSLQAGIQFSLNFSHDINWHLTPEKEKGVQLNFNNGEKYNFINRNNVITMQYKEKKREPEYKIILTVIRNNSPADGITENIIQARVVDINYHPLPDIKVEWKYENKQEVRVTTHSVLTDSNGLAYFNLTSTVPLTLPVSVIVGKMTESTDVTFVKQTAKYLNMRLVKNNEEANGVASNIIKARLTDENHNPVKGMALTWRVPGFINVRDEASVTDDNGEVQAYFSSTVAGGVTVTGSAGKLESDITMDFTPSSGPEVKIENTLKLIINGSAIADGISTNSATVYLSDKTGAPVPGAAIHISTTGDAVLSTDNINTDSHGMVVIYITDKTAETVNVTARTESAKDVITSTSFMSFGVVSLTGNKSGAAADGKDEIYLTATVRDINGNLVKNTSVVFSVSGYAVISSPSVITGNNGEAGISVSDKYGEVVTVNARAENFRSDPGIDKELTFISSKITGVTSDPVKGIFSVQSGFPFTGFKGARGLIFIDDTMDKNNEYLWKSSQSWVTVKNDGSFVMVSEPEPSSTSVIITATPKTGGESLSYKFNLRQWFYLSVFTDYPGVGQSCTGSDSIPASFEQVTTAFPGSGGAGFETGTLFGEWQGFIGPAWVSDNPDEYGNVYYVNQSDGSVRITRELYMLLPALCLTNF